MSRTQIARVVAVGPGGEVDGKEIKMYLKEGDRVRRALRASSPYTIFFAMIIYPLC